MSISNADETNFWKDRSVLVTGATGFLGSHLTQTLCDKGARVVALVRDHIHDSLLRHSGMFDRMNIVNGDLASLPLLERAIGEHEVEVVFHLAAQAIVGVAHFNPVSTFETNIAGTWNILEACRRQGGVKRVVVASSDKAYGDHDVLPYDESCALQGKHPYDVSKSCADLIALTYAHTYKLPVAITRCGNLFGPGDLNFNRIVPGTIRSVFNGQAPLIRSNGAPLRDYIYVKDAVDAYMLLAESMGDASIHGQAFNFGTAKPLSVIEIINRILYLMGRDDLKPVVLNEAKGEIIHQYLSSDKARQLLGWEPVASVDAGLQHSIAWYRTYLAE